MSNGREDYFRKRDREFFEKMFGSHDCIESFRQVGEREYVLHRTRGDTIHVHITGKYTFGIVDFFEVCGSSSSVNCIVSASSYLSYTGDAKDEGLRREIGVFSVKEFM